MGLIRVHGLGWWTQGWQSVHENSEARWRGFERNYDSKIMHKVLASLLVLFFSLSSPAMGENAIFWQSPLAAETGPVTFSNLYPGDTALPYPRRELLFDGTKWRALSENGTTVTPNGLYNFVVQAGKTYISRGNFARGGHLDLSQGLDVDYAGQIRFGHGNNAGSLRFWNNASGHFKPKAAFSHQAPLPPDLFQPFTP